MSGTKKLLIILGLIFSGNLAGQESKEAYPPEGFVYLHEAIPDIEYEIRYAGTDNFIGDPIRGYQKPVALLSTEAAEALKEVQQTLKQQGYRIKIFDAYRPQRAVDHFLEWAEDTTATSMKEEFYPEVDKSDLFDLGYLAARSGHTRGSTVDLTIVRTSDGKEVDMGSPYDLFGEISAHGATGITTQQEENRKFLRTVMEDHGFSAYPEEWWHYTLQDEPYPDTYFDFPVK